MSQVAQTMIAVSSSFAEFIKGICEAHSGPSKSRESMNLTQKEACDSLQNFVEAYWKGEETELVENPETGEMEETPIELDYFKPYADAIIAERMEKTRVSTAQKKLSEMEGRIRQILEKQGLEGEELEAAIAKVLA